MFPVSESLWEARATSPGMSDSQDPSSALVLSLGWNRRLSVSGSLVSILVSLRYFSARLLLRGLNSVTNLST